MLNLVTFNNAPFSGDERTIKKFTVAQYNDFIMKRLRSQNPSYVYVWKYHGENESPKVVSIRAEEVNMSRQPIKFGNRLLVQACVKFDTMQVRIPLYYVDIMLNSHICSRAWKYTRKRATASLAMAAQSAS